jgi:hypothetical protein
LCAGATDFYNNLHTFNCDEEAGKRGFYHRWFIESDILLELNCTSQALPSFMYRVTDRINQP